MYVLKLLLCCFAKHKLLQVVMTNEVQSRNVQHKMLNSYFHCLGDFRSTPEIKQNRNKRALSRAFSGMPVITTSKKSRDFQARTI